MKKYLSLIISLLIFLAVVIFIAFQSSGRTGGNLFYTLDDPYIHMALAKNFAESGTWGITKYEFTSCASSPLWPFLISVFYFIFGIKDIIPFILNIIFASLTALIVFKFFEKLTGNIFFQTLLILTFLFFGPFVSVVFTGLEHSMYAFFVLLTVYYLFKIFGEESKKKDTYILFAVLALLTATRYEGMFISGALFLIFLVKRKYWTSLGVLFFSFLPILIVGLISVSKGWYFFPNSILLKSTAELDNAGSLLKSFINPYFFELLWAYRRILLLLILSLVMLFLFRKNKNAFAIKSSIFIFIVVVVLHIQFAKLGSLLRYELYIIVLGLLVNLVSIITIVKGKEKKIKYSAITFLCIFIIPFSYSTFKAVRDVPIASVNIYRMQVQMAHFVNKFYPDNNLAFNDIGAVNYYCDIHCTDLWGLASMEVAREKRNQTYNSDKIFKMCKEKNVPVAIIFESWFDKYGGVPKEWKRAGLWTIPHNITCGADSVTFFATDSMDFKILQSNLKLFSKELPPQVKQKSF